MAGLRAHKLGAEKELGFAGNRRKILSRWQILTAAYQHTHFAMFGVQVQNLLFVKKFA